MRRINTIITYFLEELQGRVIKNRHEFLLSNNKTHDANMSAADFYEYTLLDWRREVIGYFSRFPSLALSKYGRNFGHKQVSEIIFEHFYFLKEAAAHFVTINDIEYPPELLKDAYPPFAINVLGSLTQLTNDKVSIVGARKASGVGLKISYDLGHFFADKGFSIVSGGAFGCDIQAHLGCLDLAQTPASAIVVMPSGFSQLIPKTHERTFQHLLDAGGTIISERLWNSPARKQDFLRRNRIIAALGQKLIVAECTLRSGAMSTANMALDIGVDVFTSAAQLKNGDIRASGNAHLIENGAAFFYNAEEAYDLALLHN